MQVAYQKLALGRSAGSDGRGKHRGVVCDGEEYPKVSDHYGVMIETEEEKKK